MCNSVLSRKWPPLQQASNHFTGAISGLKRGGKTELLLQPPSTENTLSLLNQSRISTAAHTSQHIQQLEEKREKKAFKSSVACWAGEAGRVTRRGACVLMRRLPCQLKANSGPGISEPPPWAHRYWCWEREGGGVLMVLAFSEMSHPHCCSFPMCTDCALHGEKKKALKMSPRMHQGTRRGPFQEKNRQHATYWAKKLLFQIDSGWMFLLCKSYNHWCNSNICVGAD